MAGNFMSTCMAMLAAASISSGAAFAAAPPQPPRPGCTAVPKQEYQSAQRRHLLRSRNGEYIRTGGVLRRQYWYCH